MSNQEKIQELVHYVLSFLLYGNDAGADLVGYTSDPTEWERYRLVILPNGHLGNDWVYPDLENPRHEGKFIETDIVYNTAFFLSRAEELLNTERDEHGRFAARYSLLGEQNRLQIPLLDEYSRFLTKQLEHACAEAEVACLVHLPEEGFSRVWLTHDIDTIEQYRHWRGALGGLLRGQIRPMLASWHDIHNDPAYTFPWLTAQDQTVTRRLEQAEVVYFVKQTQGRGYDYPQYSLHGHDWQQVQQLLKQTGARLGVHSSYYGACQTSHAASQSGIATTLHRSHYLRCDISRMQQLAAAGVTDDFTMGFADCAGFRLQTTRAARWINPKTWQVTNLTLHPLTAMDCTLSGRNYMNLNEDEAYYCCQRLIDKVRKNGGELCLLWHNSNPDGTPWHLNLYRQLLYYIR